MSRSGYRWYRVRTELYKLGSGENSQGWTYGVWDVWAHTPDTAIAAVGLKDTTRGIVWEGRKYNGWIEPTVKSLGRNAHEQPVFVKDILISRTDIARARKWKDA